MNWFSYYAEPYAIGMVMDNIAHLVQLNIGKTVMGMEHGMKVNIIMIGMAMEVGQLYVI